jgi:hypothetical protein
MEYPSDRPAAHDDELIDDLRRVASEADPVPDDVRAAAYAAINTRDLDAELALLIADSAAESHDLEWDPVVGYDPVRAGTAGAQTRRLLSFAAGDVQLDIEVSDHGGRLDIIGQFSGAPVSDSELEYADGGRHSLQVDSLGRFVVSGARPGAVRARFRSAGGTPVATSWVAI